MDLEQLKVERRKRLNVDMFTGTMRIFTETSQWSDNLSSQGSVRTRWYRWHQCCYTQMYAFMVLWFCWLKPQIYDLKHTFSHICIQHKTLMKTKKAVSHSQSWKRWMDREAGSTPMKRHTRQQRKTTYRIYTYRLVLANILIKSWFWR